MNEYNRGFRSLKNARFNTLMYGLNTYSEDVYPQYAYNYPFYGYGYPSFYPTAEWLSYQNYYQNYYQYYQYNYMVNNFNHLAANYNELLVENKYLKNEVSQPTPTILSDENRVVDITDSHPIREYSEPIPLIETVTNSLIDGERPTQKSRDICISALGSSKEFTDKAYEGLPHSLVYTPDTLDAPTEMTVIQPEVAPAEDMILTYDTFYTMDTYYTFDTYDEIIPN